MNCSNFGHLSPPYYSIFTTSLNQMMNKRLVNFVLSTFFPPQFTDVVALVMHVSYSDLGQLGLRSGLPDGTSSFQRTMNLTCLT